MNYNFKEIPYNENDRAQRYLAVFENLGPGQINISTVYSTNHIVAWHKHNIQTDYWVCVKGSFKVGLATREEGAKFEYLSDRNPRVLEIPPGIYHGYKALEPGSILMYYMTEKWNPEDELRAIPGAFKDKWKTENK